MESQVKKGNKKFIVSAVNVLRKTRIGTNFPRRSRTITFDGPCKVVVFGC